MSCNYKLKEIVIVDINSVRTLLLVICLSFAINVVLGLLLLVPVHPEEHLVDTFF